VLGDHDAAGLERAAAELTRAGARVTSLAVDVARAADLTALAAHARATFGKVHLLCNNAGVAGHSGPMWTSTENDWTWTVSVNLMGVVNGIRAFVGDMIAHGEEAHVVNTASIAGLLSPPYMGAYVASKHAVVALSETLARELQIAKASVRVSVLCRQWVRTNIFESERHRPAELANPRADGDDQKAANTGMLDAVKALIAAGKDPSEIADHVVRAVREERFYILPHEETRAAVEQRFRDIRDDRYPRYNDDFRR
jgi:NAD(P)-dependent dehydrogenase (short-subunit alcohol dehydrogenase family)